MSRLTSGNAVIELARFTFTDAGEFGGYLDRIARPTTLPATASECADFFNLRRDLLQELIGKTVSVD